MEENRISIDRDNPIGFENLYNLSRTVDRLFEETALADYVEALTFLKTEVVALGQKSGFQSDETMNYAEYQAIEILVRLGQLETFLCKLYELRSRLLFRESRRLMQSDGY